LPGEVFNLIFRVEAPGPGGNQTALFRHQGARVMEHTIAELQAKIHEMYPDIDKYGVESSVTFDQGKNAFVLELKKDVHHLATYINKEDADKCLDNIECVHLGVQIGEFLENFKKV
jgi:hypothetical protein